MLKFLKAIVKDKLIVGVIVVLILIGAQIPTDFVYHNYLLRTEASKLRSLDLDSQASLYPKLKSQPDFDNLSSKAVLVFDPDSAVVLYQKNSDTKLLPASTQKLMTAVVALENCSMDKVVSVVGQFEKEGSQMGLVEGEHITVRSLMYGLLINSGNDAASVLAQNCASDEQDFVALMNKKAAEIGMKNTHFANPTGLDDEGLYSTALDLGRLASYAMQQRAIAQIVSVSQASVADASLSIWHPLHNVNRLLGQIQGLLGIKTGETAGAKENLISLTRRGNHSLIVIVLGSNDRFGETTRLIDWFFTNTTWEKIN